MADEGKPLLAGTNHVGAHAVGKAINTGDSDTGHIRYPIRWLVLNIVVLLEISNAMQWITFAPIANIASEHYDTTPYVINWLSLSYMVLYIVITPFAMWSLDHKGLRFSLVIAAWLNATGSFLRYFGDTYMDDAKGQLSLIFVGSALCAIAQPLILGSPTAIAGTWFGDSERATANMLMSVANPLGIAIGSILSPTLVGDNSGKEISFMLLVFAIPAGVGALVTTLFLRNKPPTPPSSSAAEESHPFFEGLRIVFRNKAFVCLFVAFGMGTGIFNSVTTLLAQILAPEGYTSDDAGLFGAILIGCGLLGAAVCGVFLDMTGKFLTAIRVAFWVATVSFVAFTLELKPDNNVVIGAIAGLMGFCCFAVLPAALELGVECTYPVGEATSSGFLWMGGNLFGIIFILLMEYPLQGKMITPGNNSDTVMFFDDELTTTTTTSTKIKSYPDMKNACYLMIGIGVCASILTSCMKTDYKRRMSETLYKTASQM